MVKYRFKTKEEFIRDGQWNNKHDRPFGWNDAGRMNRYIGEDVPEKYNQKCDKGLSIFIDDWHFASSNYVLKETKPVNRYTDFVFIPGNIYVGEWDSNRVIFKPTTACLEDPCYIINSIDEFRFNRSGCCYAKEISFREANQEERDWLEACIEANTTVPKPSNSIPEYAECVIEIAGCYGEKGKIYKVKVWHYSHSDCLLEGTTSDSTDRSRFKPSTKEAYDAQNSPVIDKWAIKCTEENRKHLEKFFHSKGSEYVGYTPSWDVSTRHYYHYPQQEEGLWGHIAIQKDYREITNEEFYKIAGVVIDIPDDHPDKFPVEQKMFKKGDYIVYLSEGTPLLLRNYCYKQSQDENYLRVEKDVSGAKNGWPALGCYEESDNWRYATPEEIAEYNRLDKPYDVRTISNKVSFKQGDYIVITKSNASYYNGDLNYCYKLINNYFHVADNSRIPLDQPEYKKARLATPEEIAEYDKLGEPYDVTTLFQKQSSIPKYVKCINGYGNALVGRIYRTDDEYQAKSLFGMTWEQVLIKYNHLGINFIPVTYLEYSEHHSEKAEESKPSKIGYPIKKETLIEDVHSVSVMLSTKNKSKQFKF